MDAKMDLESHPKVTKKHQNPIFWRSGAGFFWIWGVLGGDDFLMNFWSVKNRSKIQKNWENNRNKNKNRRFWMTLAVQRWACYTGLIPP